MTQNEKILVIEDTPSIQEVLVEILTLEGFDVSLASNGIEGIEKALMVKPDLILCDIMMPHKDGFEVYDELKKNVQTDQIPFIFLTAKSDPIHIRDGMNLGADDYIVKPFDIDLLIQSVKQRLKKSNQRKKQYKTQLNNIQQSISLAIPHELLTPLNAILGFSSMLKDNSELFSLEDIRELGSDIHSSTKQLLKVVKQIIYYSEVEQLISTVENKEILKNKLTSSADSLMYTLCSKLAQQTDRIDDLEFNFPQFNLKIDQSHFEIILSELISNALKFSSKGEKIQIIATKEETYLKLSIADYGIGIKQEQIKSVNAFIQFDRAKQEQEGIGIGLITAKKLIEFYDGEFEIIANPKKGTTVNIKLLLA